MAGDLLLAVSFWGVVASFALRAREIGMAGLLDGVGGLVRLATYLS